MIRPPGAVRPPKNAPDLPKFVADNALVTVTGTAYEKVKTVQAVLTEEDKGRKFTIRFSHRGKARLTVKDEAGNVHLEKEYSSAEEAVQTEEVKLKKKSGSVLVAILELASPDGTSPAENRIFEVSYGQAEFEYGVVQALPVSFSTTVHSVRLSYTGNGVVFQVSTDGGTKWQKIEPGREVMLDEPGTELLVKILLLIDPARVLYDYRLEINPYHDMSFTGKFLEPEIGLIYFGGRWYEPGIGRWVTVDPAEDGENWYSYCVGNPIRYIDISGFGVYRFGEFAVPDIKFDEDFPYDPALKASVRDRLSWIWWGFKAFCASVLRKDLSDAVKAYRHYRSGKGGVLIIDYEKAYKEDQIIRVFVNDEIMSAQKEAERLFRANKNKLSTIFGDIKAFNMLGSAVPVPNGLTENWQKTIGAHFIWGSAFVCINKSSYHVAIN